MVKVMSDALPEMFDRAASVLRRNDMGGWTRAAPDLYPHQWSWDSAFIAIGLAHLDVRRAASELTTLFDGQWTTGKVPHIVFNPKAPPGSYLLGPEHWASASLSRSAAGTPRPTSALCQPAVHAIAALRIFDVSRGSPDEVIARAFLSEVYGRLFRWHRYLATARDPEGSGLVAIYHPCECVPFAQTLRSPKTPRRTISSSVSTSTLSRSLRYMVARSSPVARLFSHSLEACSMASRVCCRWASSEAASFS